MRESHTYALIDIKTISWKTEAITLSETGDAIAGEGTIVVSASSIHITWVVITLVNIGARIAWPFPSFITGTVPAAESIGTESIRVTIVSSCVAFIDIDADESGLRGVVVIGESSVTSADV